MKAKWQANARADSDGFGSKVMLVSLLRLVHLGIALAVLVLVELGA